MGVTHQDIEPGMDVFATPARPKPGKNGWFKARVIKRYSRGAQVRYLEGPHKGREVSVDYSRVRLDDETIAAREKKREAGVVEKRSAVLDPILDFISEPKPIPDGARFADAMRASQEPEPEPEPEGEDEDVESQVSAWLEMGRELTAPLERRAKELDEEIAFINGQVAELDAERARLGEARAEIETKLQKVRRLLGDAAK